MWKKHKRELIGCVLAAIGIVLGLLIMVYIFEGFGIHVPGTREMWIGLIGAVIGGVFTLLGVLITIYKQEEADDERIRIENMPILGVDCYQSSLSDCDPILIAGILGNEIVTSAFPTNEVNRYGILNITSANQKPVFNLQIADFYISNKGVLKKSEAFATGSIRLVNEENINIMIFHEKELCSDYLCVVRFIYDDIFFNKYIQDVPFVILERNIDGCEEQLIEIRDIGQPIFIKEDVPSLGETVKGFKDYEVFKQ